MILEHETIKNLLIDGTLQITPLQLHRIKSASYDVSLGLEIKRMAKDVYVNINPFQPQEGLFESEFLGARDKFIYPGEFILATTNEIIKLNNTIAAQLIGKSSIGRLGLAVHCTAGYIDPGFEGQLTLELSNLTPYPIKLLINMKIAQLVFHKLFSPTGRPYGHSELRSKYQDQRGATESKYYLEE